MNKTENICIAQQDMNEDCYIALPADQVDPLVNLLREKQKEAVAFQQAQLGDF